MLETKKIEDFKPDDEVKICRYLDGNEDGACILIEKKQALCYPRSIGSSIIKDYRNIDLTEMIETRKEFFLKLNNNQTDACDGCIYLKTKKMKDVNLDKFALLNVANYTTCSLRCKYCYFNDEQLGADLPKESRQLLPIVKNMAQQGLFADNIMLAIAGGEPTLFDDIPETLEYLNKNYKYARFNLQSNSTLTKKVEKLIKPLQNFKAGFKNLYTSIDAGTPETYKSIRQRNFFENLKKNLYMYAKAGAFTFMQLKYILLNEEGMYNLGLKDLYGFMEIVFKVAYLNPNNTEIVIDRNLYKRGIPFSKEMLQAASILVYGARKIKVRVCYSACGYIEQEDIKTIEKMALEYSKKKKSFKELLLYLKFNTTVIHFNLLKNIKKIAKIIKMLKVISL